MKNILYLFLFSGPLFLSAQDSLQVKDTLTLEVNAPVKVQEYRVADNMVLVYEKPRISDLYRKIPRNVANVATDVVSKNIYPYSLASLGLTAALIPLDPMLTREGRKLGERVGFHEDHTYNNLGPLKILPGDAGSFFYFMGNGTTFILIGSGLAAYGLIKNDYRAISTSMQLVQSILLSGVYSQTLKRISGRESPFITARNGREHSHWTFMPSFSAYQENTSSYDAMPSGHLMTGVAAWVVLADNYPEKKWIKPLGISLMAMMSFEMVQSGVHWTSDYPIALLLGYLIGKNVVKNAVKKRNATGELAQDKKYIWNISSSTVYGHRVAGVTVNF